MAHLPNNKLKVHECLLVFTLAFLFIISCSTENPLCTDNYCVKGEIFDRADLGNEDFTEMPRHIDEKTLYNLLNPDRPILHDLDQDVFFINGVVDFVLDHPASITMSVDIDRNRPFDSKNVLDIFVTSFDNPKLIEGIKEGERYTVKVKPYEIDDEISFRDGVFLNYKIWFSLIQVM